MPPIDVNSLPDLPAPLWFVGLFKVLGFTLHAIFMNLWFAGILVVLVCAWRFGDHGRRLARRFMRPMPVVMAFGINLGIVPLLFLQLAYAPVFYPATILMAWHWLGIIPTLALAYYGVYAYAGGLAAGEGRLRTWHKAAGWFAAVALVLIGYVFANAMSLMTNAPGWIPTFLRYNVAGAATGLALNHGDPTRVVRWLLMFGLALGTSGAWIALDAGCFAAKENAPYRRWAASAARVVAILGAAVAMAAGGWYVFRAWRPEVFQQMLGFADHPGLAFLTMLTASAPLWTAGLLLAWGGSPLTPWRGATIAGVQAGVLAINAVSRQVVQNIELGIGGFFPVAQQNAKTDWGPLCLFLGAFAAGAVVVGWMLWQLRRARSPEIA